MRKVGMIGLGLLGGAVAGRLLKAGFAVTCYDVRREAVEPLAREGLTPAADVAGAVRDADAVFVILPSLESVDLCVRGPRGVLDSVRSDAVVLQMSTISPPLTKALAAAAAARSIGFLDTPMSGTAAMVAQGDCHIFVGGDVALAERCRPVFEAIAKRFLHVGAVGDACLAKLAANLLVGVNTVAVAEALVLGAKGGLDPARLLDVLKQSAGASRMLEVRGPLMVERRFEPQMKSELFLKDFHLMLEEGRRLGVALPLTGLAEQLCTATCASGRGQEDIAAVITTLERLAGTGE